MVAPQVNHLGPVLLHFAQDHADKPRVLAGPVVWLAAKVPGVDDVAVENEFLATGAAEEIVDFGDLAIRCAEVDIGEKNGFITDESRCRLVTIRRHGYVVVEVENRWLIGLQILVDSIPARCRDDPDRLASLPPPCSEPGLWDWFLSDQRGLNRPRQMRTSDPH